MSTPSDQNPSAGQPFQLETRLAPPRIAETDEHKFMRQTRNAVVTLAVIAVLGVIGSLISIIVAIAAVNHEANVLSNNGTSPNPSSTCLSQGGTDPSC
jgi:hypothetical protein